MELIKKHNEENLFKTQFTDSGIVIIALLVLTLIALFERVLYDLSRTFAGTIGSMGYFDNQKVIIIHALFIIPLLIITMIVNYTVGRRKEKYALILIPYFFTSVFLALQLALQLGVYFTMHHNNLQFYLVMSLLVVVTTYGIYHIQNNYRRPEREGAKGDFVGLWLAVTIIFSLFAFLILSFNDTTTTEQNPQFYNQQ